jgi:hypothetical protein
MARYDFRCTSCEQTFELTRPMADADDPASCPQGHEGARRLLPVFTATGMASIPATSGGGCCGGGCCA